MLIRYTATLTVQVDDDALMGILPEEILKERFEEDPQDLLDSSNIHNIKFLGTEPEEGEEEENDEDEEDDVEDDQYGDSGYF